MAGPDLIDAYLRELKQQLHGQRGWRRRILAEVHVHLLEATEAELSGAAEESGPAERAIARFGLTVETARQFNRLAGRRGTILRRALVPWIAAVVLVLLATATVWASHPGAAQPLPRETPQHHVGWQRCGERAVVFARRARRAVPRPLLPTAQQTRIVCGARDTYGR